MCLGAHASACCPLTLTSLNASREKNTLLVINDHKSFFAWYTKRNIRPKSVTPRQIIENLKYIRKSVDARIIGNVQLSSKRALHLRPFPFPLSMTKPRSHFEAVATPLVPLHVAADTESLSTPGVRALEWLLARVRVAMDSKTAGSAESLVAGLADVAVLTLWV